MAVKWWSRGNPHIPTFTGFFAKVSHFLFAIHCNELQTEWLTLFGCSSTSGPQLSPSTQERISLDKRIYNRRVGHQIRDNTLGAFLELIDTMAFAAGVILPGYDSALRHACRAHRAWPERVLLQQELSTIR